MKRIFGFLEQKLAPMGEKIGKQRHLKALREGIMMAMPCSTFRIVLRSD